MSGRADLLLVCSPGGHLLQLLALRGAWGRHSRVWVCERTSDSVSLLSDERIVLTHSNAERSVFEFLRNLWLAWRLLREVRPKVILTTGAAVAVPFAWLGRILGVRVIHVESLTRMERLSLSGRLISMAADRFYVQWPELAESVDGAIFAGQVFAL